MRGWWWMTRCLVSGACSSSQTEGDMEWWHCRQRSASPRRGEYGRLNTFPSTLIFRYRILYVFSLKYWDRERKTWRDRCSKRQVSLTAESTKYGSVLIATSISWGGPKQDGLIYIVTSPADMRLCWSRLAKIPKKLLRKVRHYDVLIRRCRVGRRC